MGHKHSKKKYEATIGSSYTCPSCQHLFDSKTSTKEVNEHIINCSHSPTSLSSKELYTSLSLDFKPKKNKTMSTNSVAKLNPLRIKDYIKTKKIDWIEGCDNIKICRENCLEESIKEIEKVNLWKEVKISFNGEVSYDAGGLFREWFIILIEELEKKEMKLFEKSECDEISYIFNKDLNKDSYWSFKYFRFIGKLMAKSIIDNITINLSFNNLIYKLILEEKIIFEDLKNIDTYLYSSLLSLKNMKPEELDLMEIYYTYQYEDSNGKLITDELIEGGEDKKVTDINDYIDKRINYMVKKAKVLVEYIQEGLFAYIPKYVIKSLNSYELELLICGTPFIDINDWKKNSIYKGKFSKSSSCVKWFWEEMYKLDQENLRRFLQFSTGSSRVPINGFQNLESNRGEIAKYCLNSVPYNKNGNNFIRAHTCFNRIDVPVFKKKTEVHDAIQFVLKNITGFGID
jgi:hypothetical protein